MNRTTLFLTLGLLILASLLAACGTREVVRTVEVEVTRIVTQEVLREMEATPEPIDISEVDLSLASLAQDIQAGRIDVGEEFGIEPGKRFHNIHVEALGALCTQCHVKDAPYELDEPAPGSPGPVDRRVCLGCHVSGPASNLYEPKE